MDDRYPPVGILFRIARGAGDMTDDSGKRDPGAGAARGVGGQFCSCIKFGFSVAIRDEVVRLCGHARLDIGKA